MNRCAKNFVLMFFIFYICISLVFVMGKSYDPIDYRIQIEPTPSIQYKYIEKTLLPTPDSWWKRGTHQIYAPGQKVVTP